MKLPSLFLVLLLASACSSAIPKKTDREEMEVRGFVRSVKTTFYRVVEKDGKIVRGPSNNGLESVILFFNRDGMTVRKEYRYVSLRKDEAQTERVQSYFDASGKKVRDSLWSSYPDVWDGFYVYTYDSEDRLTDKSFFSRTGKRGLREHFRYHPNGTVAVRTVYMDGKKAAETFSSYDDNGNAIKSTTFYSGTKRKLVQENTYDSDNRLTEYKSTSFPEGTKMRVQYRYNEHGDLSEKFSFNAQGLELIEKHTYVYDSRGNWTKSTESLGASPVQITEREIAYF